MNCCWGNYFQSDSLHTYKIITCSDQAIYPGIIHPNKYSTEDPSGTHIFTEVAFELSRLSSCRWQLKRSQGSLSTSSLVWEGPLVIDCCPKTFDKIRKVRSYMLIDPEDHLSYWNTVCLHGHLCLEKMLSNHIGTMLTPGH